MHRRRQRQPTQPPSTLGPLWLTPCGHPVLLSPAATGDGDGVCEAEWPHGVSREQVARFIHERVAQLSSLQTPRVNKGPMREKRESPSLVAMRASGALLAMCERSPSPAHRDLESALATPTAPYLISQAGALDQRHDHGDRGRATAGTSGARVVAAQGLVA